MFKFSETGHPKNVANFKTLISICEGFGEAYNPGMVNITKASLDALYSNANAVLENVRNTKANEQLVTNQRRLAFQPLLDTMRRVVSFLDACGAEEETLKDARGIIRHVQGGSKSKKTNLSSNPLTSEENEESTGRSTSHTSFDSRLHALKSIIQLVVKEPKYNPNEASISLNALISLAENLDGVNILANQSIVQATNARVERDRVLYQGDSNLLETADAVKKYTKAAFGKNSTQYKQVSKLLFVYMPSMQ